LYLVPIAACVWWIEKRNILGESNWLFIKSTTVLRLMQASSFVRLRTIIGLAILRITFFMAQSRRTSKPSCPDRLSGVERLRVSSNVSCDRSWIVELWHRVFFGCIEKFAPMTGLVRFSTYSSGLFSLALRFAAPRAGGS
jgi:hypothetical protein